uniref:Uncharacterized protein n=1 Tax=Anopheles merus TaxID=30066 RepID=A0A182V864_ANOME
MNGNGLCTTPEESAETREALHECTSSSSTGVQYPYVDCPTLLSATGKSGMGWRPVPPPAAATVAAAAICCRRCRAARRNDITDIRRTQPADHRSHREIVPRKGCSRRTTLAEREKPLPGVHRGNHTITIDADL